VNSIVLTVRRKTPKPTDRSQNSVGSEFQTIGAATEKARWSNAIRARRLVWKLRTCRSIL